MVSAEDGIPRPEHPRPQCERERWLNLNGVWEFEEDPGDSGVERGLHKRALAERIRVPFCREARLSGLERVDRVLAVWYRRTATIPADWRGCSVLLHFQGVDQDATVWVNGREVAHHRGGFTPFTCPLAGVASPGQDITIVVRVRDDWRGPQARGKQARDYANHGCLYTRTTGIWQTVWLEAVGHCHFTRPRITPELAASRFRLQLPLVGDASGLRVRARLLDAQGVVERSEGPADGDFAPALELRIPEERRRLWSPDDPHLYRLELAVIRADGTVMDQVRSYAGLRSVRIAGNALLINGQRLFQRLVLDQGYYPDGIMTAPSDQALVDDIAIAQTAGFNGARLHQKVFEERFLYHADRLGYLCWGEFGDWGADSPTGPDGRGAWGADLIAQWLEAMERDYSHPSIIGWCALNEQRRLKGDAITAYDDLARALVLSAHGSDHTRPILDCSGWTHRVAESDIYDHHDYDQDPERLRARHLGVLAGKPVDGDCDGVASLPYRGQPYFISEFGGAWWSPAAAQESPSWGYGERPRTEQEFYTRFAGLCAALLDNPGLFGYCYTQLTDVFQEQNGIVRFDRSRKLDLERLRQAQQRPSAYERMPAPPAAALAASALGDRCRPPSGPAG